MKTRHLFPLLAIAALHSSCSQADNDHFWGLDAQPGYRGPSDYYRNSGGYQAQSAAAPDRFYEQQNAAREANLKAGRELQYQHQMQSYQNGYRSTLPNY